MTNMARYMAVVLTVSMIAPVGVVAGIGGDYVESSVDDIGQRDADLIDHHATTSDRLGAESPTRRVVTHVAAAAEPDLPVEPVGLMVCYSRYGKSDPLENSTRQALYDTVTSAPGRSVTTLARDIDVPVSTARYHIRVLEDENLIDRYRIDGRSRLYPDGYGDDPELIAALAASAPTAVIDAVRTAQPVTVTALAARADLAPSTTSYHVSRLTDSGVFECEKEGKTVRVSLSADAMRLLGDTPEEEVV